jgi:predicted permease
MTLVTRARSIRFSTLDFKVGTRMLARYPGLTIVGTAAMAVAIALGTVYFEAVSKWKHPRLPIPGADRVISIRAWDVKAFREEARLLHDFATWRGQLKSIDHVGAAVGFVRNLATNDGRIESVRGAEMSANAFAMLGVAAIKGRALTEQDERSAEPVVVISHALWKARFDTAPNIIGRVVKLGTISATIVGVMPEGFGFPVNHQIWTPLRVDATLTPRTGPAVSIFGRLAPHASIDEARAELGVVTSRMAASAPETHKHLRLRLTAYEEPFGEGPGWRWFNGLLDLVNGVLVGLLTVVSINIATLVFARTATRGWEITVRTALGASRARIIAQLFIEALLLTALAAIVGLGIAKAAIRIGLQLFATWSDVLPYWVNDHLSWTTVLYTTLLMFFAAAIVGVLPALRVTRINVQDALRNEAAARAGLAFGGFWTTVIVVQVAITVAFLPIAANGLFAANRFRDRAEGIGAEHYLAARIDMDRENFSLDSATFAAQARARGDELQRRLLLEPGVEAVAFAERLPVEDQWKYGIEVDTAAGLRATDIRVSTLASVSDGFFGAFGTSVMSGRDFTPVDFENGNVVIVNQAFARYVLGGRNAVGQRIRLVGSNDVPVVSNDWFEIVGVVNDFGWPETKPEDRPILYRPSLPIVGRASQVAVRVRDPAAFAARLRTVALDVDPTIRLTDVQPLSQVGGGEVRRIRTLTAVAWAIAFVVLLLSATGIHALMAFTVTRRTREIGIRAALGATNRHIVRGIFSRAFTQMSTGVLVGSALVALVGLGSMRTLWLLLSADTVMLVVGLTACALPLRRALRIDPTEALRVEG